MDQSRRRLLAVAGTGLAGAAGLLAWNFWPEQGWLNPCLGAVPPELLDHPLVREAWEGLDPANVWDAHVHLLGAGDGGDAAATGYNDRRGTWQWPFATVQREALRNAACVGDATIDGGYVARLAALAAAWPAGSRFLLFALDRWHDDRGVPDTARSQVWIGNDHAARIVARYPRRFLFAGSVHPYRSDAILELERVQRLGARAIKWIPSAQNIDAAAPRCDAYYRALVRLGLPLITHGGQQRALPGDDGLGNPLQLRRALDHGVRVVVAHCASMGESRDLDRGAGGPWVASFTLFERLMDEPAFVGRLYGDLSAVTQSARAGASLRRIVERASDGGDWAGRLLNGSDYPLPAVMPLYSPRALAEAGLLPAAAVEPLSYLRRHNPLLFDFVQKRQLRSAGRRLSRRVFQTRTFFSTEGAAAAGL